MCVLSRNIFFACEISNCSEKFEWAYAGEIKMNNFWNVGRIFEVIIAVYTLFIDKYHMK